MTAESPPAASQGSGSGGGAAAAQGTPPNSGQQQQQQQLDVDAFLRAAKHPLVKHTDMGAEMREEALDVCITAVEKHPHDVEKCTQMIKDQMDKKFGPPWHVVVGRAFAYDITYEVRVACALCSHVQLLCRCRVLFFRCVAHQLTRGACTRTRTRTRTQTSTTNNPTTTAPQHPVPVRRRDDGRAAVEAVTIVDAQRLPKRMVCVNRKTYYKCVPSINKRYLG
jgi:dynein light chain 4